MIEIYAKKEQDYPVEIQMMDTRRKGKINQIILAGIFLGYLIFNGVLLAGHEPWRDEANVWIMARELSPLELFKEIRYQGHPCLWYLLIMPFAKVGLSFRAIGYVSYCVMAVSAGLFIFKAPFHKLVKSVAVFSPIFTYYYAEIARNYCLIALFLVLLALYYPKRNEKCILYGLLLGLLVQSDTIALMAAGMISLMWLGEAAWKWIKEKSPTPLIQVLKGIWIPLVSLFFLIAQFYHVSDSPVFEMKRFGLRELAGEVRNYGYYILERLTGRGEGFCLLFFVLILGLLLAVSLQLKNFWSSLVLVAAYFFEALFSVMVYQLHIWHFIALCFVMLWTMWVLYLQKEERQAEGKVLRVSLAGLQIMLLVLSVCMFMRWNAPEEASGLDNALHGLYSDGEAAAEYIRENVSSQELVVSVNVPYASTVLAYLPEYRFYFAGSGQAESYADWSEEQSGEISLEELQVWVKKNFPDRKAFYLLDSADSCLTGQEGLWEQELLYETKETTARGEEYRLYRVVLQ